MTVAKKEHRVIRVYGRVQGVGFRYFTRKCALDTGVTGFVSNENDGSVYIEAEGSPGQLDIFVEMCRQGTARAIVSDVRIIPGPPVNYLNFRIR